MTDQAPAPAAATAGAPQGAPPPPAPPGGAPPPAGNDSDSAVSALDRVGNVLLVVSLAGLAVVLLDVAFKGRILGPLFARLAAARAAVPPQEDTEDAGLPDPAG